MSNSQEAQNAPKKLKKKSKKMLTEKRKFGIFNEQLAKKLWRYVE